MIPYKNRFHGHSSLKYVYKNGEAIRSHLATIKFISNSRRKNTRVAVIVSKKIIKSAVSRNRIRRRIYEYIRPKIEHIKGIYDIAIIASSGELYSISHEELVKQLDQLFSQAEI